MVFAKRSKIFNEGPLFSGLHFDACMSRDQELCPGAFHNVNFTSVPKSNPLLFHSHLQHTHPTCNNSQQLDLAMSPLSGNSTGEEMSWHLSSRKQGSTL